MKYASIVALVMWSSVVMACRQTAPSQRRPLVGSGWVEETAVRRGHIKPGDIGQFGCPPGWAGVEDTAAALRGKEVSTVYLGVDPVPRDGTVTCVAQVEFGLPQASTANTSAKQPLRRPLILSSVRHANPSPVPRLRRPPEGIRWGSGDLAHRIG